jgi:hypothetical protein
MRYAYFPQNRRLGDPPPQAAQGLDYGSLTGAVAHRSGGGVVRAHSILGGLHHEYFWAPVYAHWFVADDGRFFRPARVPR